MKRPSNKQESTDSKIQNFNVTNYIYKKQKKNNIYRDAQKWLAKHCYEGPRQGQAELLRNNKNTPLSTKFAPFSRSLYVYRKYVGAKRIAIGINKSIAT